MLKYFVIFHGVWQIEDVVQVKLLIGILEVIYLECNRKSYGQLGTPFLWTYVNLLILMYGESFIAVNKYLHQNLQYEKLGTYVLRVILNIQIHELCGLWYF